MRVPPPIAAVAALALAAAASAGEARGAAPKVDGPDEAERNLIEEQEGAAEYRLARSQTPATPAMDAVAREYLSLARDLVAAAGPAGPDEPPRVAEIRAGRRYAIESLWSQAFNSRLGRAQSVAERGFDRAPYSALAGELLAIRLEAAAANGELDVVRESLQKLWFWLPEYAGIGRSMRQALEAAEKAQAFATAVDLDAADPTDVVRIEGESQVASNTVQIFRFLARYGDRGEVAPRASLGLARALLRSAVRDDRFAARRAYEDFLAEYPSHRLTFTALLELTLSHMQMYRGDDYDVGALMTAGLLIDQAEHEIGGDPQRRATVDAYRRRVQSWHQDRDLAVARWYRSKRMPLGAIAQPIGVDDWVAGARLYYREVVRRDPASAQGQAAERESAALPPETTPGLVPLVR